MKSFLFILSIASTMLITSCKDDTTATLPKPTFVLVHGAFAGQYAWQFVKPKLEQAGYSVITFDLPTHGDDQTPITGATLDTYVSLTVQKINAISGR